MLLLSFNRLSLSYRMLRNMVSWQSTAQAERIPSVKAEKFKDRINYHLQLNFSDCEYNVTRLSRDMGMSRSQLFRKCKLILRKSPVALIKQYRLEKSRELLKSGIYNVSEAAYLAGFNSLSYFSKSFKKNYGEIPSKWVA